MPDPYISLIIGGLLIALSYAFNLASKRFKVPSVIFLILTGIIIKFAADSFNFGFGDNLFYTLKLLGIVGLIMIVLEAAIDLEISKDKLKVIKKSFFLALAILVITSFGTAFIIMAFLNESFFKSLVYAIPMCVVSSAVVIPSVHALAKDKMEFIIYEATFSDIIG
ncbi:MAG: monovalent cation:H+ antiporter, family, partial [Bacteroidota bacterium]|nr:monovalent cation:H+ antiporter, family [Bacteroidota bacterium]